MRDLIFLLVHIVTTVMRVVQPGGVRAVIAESVLAKHHLLIVITENLIRAVSKISIAHMELGPSSRATSLEILDASA